MYVYTLTIEHHPQNRRILNKRHTTRIGMRMYVSEFACVCVCVWLWLQLFQIEFRTGLEMREGISSVVDLFVLCCNVSLVYVEWYIRQWWYRILSASGLDWGFSDAENDENCRIGSVNWQKKRRILNALL